MEYLTHEKYEHHGGTLSAAAFFAPERQAEREIDAATFGRICAEFDGTQEYTSDLTVLMLGLMHELEKERSAITAESCDGVSASYNQRSMAENIAARARLISVMLNGYKAKNGVLLLSRAVAQL